MEHKEILEELITRYPKLKDTGDKINEAAERLIRCYQLGNKVLICGNGGSSSDSDHIAGELLKGFENNRPIDDSMRGKLLSVSGKRGLYLADRLQTGLPAISLSAHTGLVTAVANDIDASLIYAQQVIGFGNPGDVLIGISTSGNAQNVLDAAITARAKGLTIIGMTGETGGKLKSFCDILINVPEKRTAFVQELHLPVYHTLCLMVEKYFFEKQE
ncbi:MAG: SIS domain-containing protein [Bacteroidales bacterium]|nr:SIS domain-containing protein [Bacteroidales bacterium]